MIEETIKKAIRDVEDFPKPGIVFKDITPIFQDAELSAAIVDHLVELYRDSKLDAIVGIESRGFFFGFPLAMALNLPFIPIRKKGKLPYKTESISYDLEYGSAEIEVHQDALRPGMKVLIHDDLLATGGTAAGAAALVEKLGAEVHAFNFIVELSFLEGQEKLRSFNKNMDALCRY